MKTERTNSLKQQDHKIMKLKNIGSPTSKAGTTMTDYLFFLALVAVACIVLASVFGHRLRDISRRSTGALAGQSLAVAEKNVEVGDTHMGNFAGRDGNGLESGSNVSPGGENVGNVGNGLISSTLGGGEVSNTHEDELWNKFKDKLEKNIVKAAKEDYKVNINSVFKAAAQDLDLTEEVYQQMVKRAAAEYAIRGEMGAINTLEALQDVRATLARGQEASKAVAIFDVLDKGSKVISVVGAVKDIYDFGSEMEKSMSDPAHQHEHEGNAVGTAVGAAGGAALIAFTAPISVPVLIIGVIGATLIGVLAKPAFGWLGSWFDGVKADRTVVKVE